MLNEKAQFFFYLAAFICLILAAIGEAWKYGARSRGGLPARLLLLPLGLALWVFPLMWNTGYHAFK
ncbi:MAG TPA: hypothetical protein VIK61_11915 [Acidimicrobiia bacterium]|jgi:hypothetical protein